MIVYRDLRLSFVHVEIDGLGGDALGVFKFASGGAGVWVELGEPDGLGEMPGG